MERLRKTGRGQSLNADSVNMGGKYIPSEETKHAARKVLCSFATDSKEAIEFMKMLGIHPSQTDEEIAIDVYGAPS